MSTPELPPTDVESETNTNNDNAATSNASHDTADADNVGAGYAYRKPLKTLPQNLQNLRERTQQFYGELKTDKKLRVKTIIVGCSVALMFVVLVLSTCSPRKSSPFLPAPETVTLGGEKFSGEKFIGLEATRKTQNKDLIAELKNIVNNNETPNDLSTASTNKDATLIDMFISERFCEKSEQDALTRLYNESPLGSWTIPPSVIKKLKPDIRRLQRERDLLRKVFDDQSSLFQFDIVNYEGSADALPVKDYLSDYMLVEEFSAAAALDEGDLTIAVTSLCYLFKAAEKASRAYSLAIRLSAAAVREKACHILQTLVLSPDFSAAYRDIVVNELVTTLRSWQPDQTAWIGERANGMLTFERIRLKGLNEGLSSDELVELVNREIYDKVYDNLLYTIDPDEAFYLQSFSKLITESENPFYERGGFCSNLESDIRTKYGTDEEPYISGFLLKGVRGKMRLQAIDKARIESCYLALALASGKRPPKTIVDPVFGKPYTIQETETSVSVGFSPELKPFVVPKTK
ncbi:MAG: hypothetical protein LBU65_00615 [Planctomycetaceae bacterium]|nr:hypothetical protein [Planctomycetaceae bacterium]